MDYVRDAPLGHAIRFMTGNKSLQYPEELSGFEFRAQPESMSEKRDARKVSTDESEQDIEAQKIKLTKSEELAAGTTAADVTLVDWYGKDDPENPRNWTSGKKAWTTLLICLYTFVVYCGSAIFVPSFMFMMVRYNVSEVVSSLGLAVYVAGYGVGPMVFSPMSEIAFIGRNPPYVISFTFFFIVSIVVAVVDNFPAIMVLRFLQGFFGSPCLASGGASLQDIYDWFHVPYGFIFWVAAIYCGPALGPLLSGYAVAHNWRWSLWEIVFLAAPLMVLLACFLPETSSSTILLHRAQRLRKVTGNEKIVAASEAKKLTIMGIVMDAMIKPTEIAIKDPAICFVCVYGSLVYAIYYSFFEAFPIVYAGIYGMTIGQIGLVFLSIIVGCLISASMYASYLKYVFFPKTKKIDPTQEDRLLPALYAVWFLPIGLFIFAWTAKHSIHWIAPTIGITIYSASSFVVFQCIIVYVPLSYPDYVASLFAANDFMRSLTATGFVMFSRAMYINLGINKGVSLLGGLSVMGILGMYFLYYYGSMLRARSKFAIG